MLRQCKGDISYKDQNQSPPCKYLQYYTENTEEVENYAAAAKENSLFDYDVDVLGTDKIVSLITCTRFFGLDGPTQFRVDVRKVRDDEKITKSKVTTTDNYDIIK